MTVSFFNWDHTAGNDGNAVLNGSGEFVQVCFTKVPSLLLPCERLHCDQYCEAVMHEASVALAANTSHPAGRGSAPGDDTQQRPDCRNHVPSKLIGG